MNDHAPPISMKPSEQPWTVIVHDGRVLNRYRVEDTSSDASGVLPTDLCGGDIDVWEVDNHLSEPPRVGQPVDPLKLNWKCVSKRMCADHHNPPSTTT